MITSRICSWAPLALLLALLLSVGALAAPAQAVTARSLSLHASSVYPGAGTSVTFSGTLTKSPVGSTVKLQIRSNGTWLTARTLKTTTSAGAYKIAVVMPTYIGTYYFRSVASSTSTLSAATSSTVTIKVLKRVYATLKADRTTVAEGQLVRFSGKATSCLVGATVTLQEYKAGTWTKLTTAQLSSSCTFVRVVRPLRNTSYRLSVPRHGSYASAYSAIVKITYTGPVAPAPTITTTSLPSGSVGTAYNQTLTKTGQAGTWSKTAGSLPNGLVISSSGTISGTPTLGGTFNFTVRYAESSPYSGVVSKALSITVVSGPAITTAALPNGKRGDAYSFALSKTGADGGTWSALHLPSGISIDPATGVLSGTPVVEGDWIVAATYIEPGATGKRADKSLPLHIATSPPPVITTSTVPGGVKGAAYSQQLAATPGVEGRTGTWALTGGSLPNGVTVDGNGLLAGTPTVADDYVFTVTYTETAAQTKDTQQLVLHISPAGNSPTISTTSLANGTVGAAYSDQLSGSGLGTWQILTTKFAPPAWLHVNAVTGQLTGTPTAAGDFVVQVKYTVGLTSNTKLLTIHVDPAP